MISDPDDPRERESLSILIRGEGGVLVSRDDRGFFETMLNRHWRELMDESRFTPAPAGRTGLNQPTMAAMHGYDPSAGR
jgi:hypothetical protein